MATYKEQFESALKCENREEAQAWLDAELNEIAANGDERDPEEIVAVIKSNIGYMAGYYGRSAQRKIWELFDAPHPILGTPDEIEKLTAEDILARGYQIGRQFKSCRIVEL
jgi:hypothetical protein